MLKYLEKKLIKKFENKKYFTREELYDFYCFFNPDLKKSTFGWRIYDLKKKGIIFPIKKGIYVINDKPIYEPKISTDILKIGKKISKQYKGINYCLWDFQWINDFSIHQMNKQIIIVEVERDFIESVFFFLKDNIWKDVYVNPSEKTVDFYILESKSPIIVKKLITRSPILKKKVNGTNFIFPSLEKILVDLYIEENLLMFFPRSELINVYKNAFEYYSINYTKFCSYARRRKKEDEIKSFIKMNMIFLES